VAAAVRTGEDWGRALQAAARLPGESFPNILLIEAQRPGTTVVKGYEEWRAAGRQVSKGEPGQTSGPPVTEGAALPGAAGNVPQGLWDALCWLARREGFAVEHEHGAPADGVTFWTPRRIRILPGLDPVPAARALAHQLGHVLIHADSLHQPGATTSGDACTATQKAEADALAYITLTRYGITIPNALASPATWAGTDPRAQPAASILAAGQRITTAAARVIRHLDTSLPGTAPTASVALAVQQPATTPAPRRSPRQRPADAAITGQPPRRAAGQAVPDARLIAVLHAAETFYSTRLAGSWVPAYLHSRGFSPETAREWRAGYAPAEWSALTDHLRAASYADQEIEAAGLARRSSRGTLIDFFRDRVMLPINDQHGQIAGFTGRARPGAGPTIPKYLNSPETAVYKKATCCSASTRPAPCTPKARLRSSSKAPSTPSPSPRPAPGTSPGWPPAEPRSPPDRPRSSPPPATWTAPGR
jgi:DNA primase